MSREDYEVPNYIPDAPEDDVKPATFAPPPKAYDDALELPASIHAEVAILGAMMLDDVAISNATGLLAIEDFSLDSHQRIYQSMREMIEDRQPVDQITVGEHLAASRQLASIGGTSYLAYLVEGIPRNLNIESYVRIVKDKSLLRRIMSICRDGQAKASEQSEGAIDVATEITNQIAETIEHGEVKSDVFDSPTMAMDAADRLLDNPKEEFAIATGFAPLDKFTNGGIRLGELWIIGASPSRGKTTLARQIAKSIVRRGIPVYIHSGEMTKESWYDITACLLVGLPAWKVRDPLLMSEMDKDSLRAGLKELSTLPFHISDSGNINIDKLIWNASKAVRQHKIQLLVVDYAQIIGANGKDPKEKVTTVAHKLRVFAKDNNVAVILLSQSPRPEGRSINSKPNMFSLKESGSLEEAAHTVILPFRLVDIETGAFLGEDELIIGKQRHGPIGNIPCRLDGKYLCFMDRVVDTV